MSYNPSQEQLLIDVQRYKGAQAYFMLKDITLFDMPILHSLKDDKFIYSLDGNNNLVKESI